MKPLLIFVVVIAGLSTGWLWWHFDAREALAQRCDYLEGDLFYFKGAGYACATSAHTYSVEELKLLTDGLVIR